MAGFLQTWGGAYVGRNVCRTRFSFLNYRPSTLNWGGTYDITYDQKTRFHLEIFTTGKVTEAALALAADVADSLAAWMVHYLTLAVVGIRSEEVTRKIAPLVGEAGRSPYPPPPSFLAPAVRRVPSTGNCLVAGPHAL